MLQVKETNMGVQIAHGSQLAVRGEMMYKGFSATRIGCEKCPRQAIVWTADFIKGDLPSIEAALRHAGICSAAIKATQFEECD